MADAPKITVTDVRHTINDLSELNKGTAIFDQGGLTHLSRFENKLFADAKGSGASPYKVQVIFEDKTTRGRCSCMAARSRPFCKHAAALLVAWAREPAAFAVSDAAPAAGGEGGTKKREVKKGKVDASELMKQGVDTVSTIVRDLATSGIAALAADRADPIRALAEGLREHRLRRLSAKTLRLATFVEQAQKSPDALDVAEYAELLGDMLLTVRKLEKHLGGEPLDPKHAEELVGKTWTKKDRTPVEGLELVEYAFVARTTPDDFVIRESRMFCMRTGEHFSEKQILPAFLARRETPKKSWAGRVLEDVKGSAYPTYAPRRIDLEVVADSPLDDEALTSVIEKAMPDVKAAVSAFQEHRKDVFAPDTFPVAVRAPSIVADGPRLRVADASGTSLFLPDDAAVEERFGSILRSGTLEVVLGDVVLDGALPMILPLAAIVKDRSGLSLQSIAGVDPALITGRKLKKRADLPKNDRGMVSQWAEVARAAGVSAPAVVLGEIREELAHAMTLGLGSVNPRFAEPIVSRLKEMSLAKPADLLTQVAARTDASEKLDDLVKLHQVLGIALLRLTSATPVEHEKLTSVPTYASVLVRKPEKDLVPVEVAREIAAGRLSRYEASVHYARHYGSIDPARLASEVYPTWADGAAAPFVARAFATRGEAAVELASSILSSAGRVRHIGSYAYYASPSSASLVSRLTAVHVLEAVATDDAKAKLLTVSRSHESATVRAHARRAVHRLGGPGIPEEEVERRQKLCDALVSASAKEDRNAAIRALVDGGHLEAIPYLRASFAGDVSGDVREEAAYALAKLGDVESIDAFLRMLRGRLTSNDAGKIGAYALGFLGDVRGIEELIDAYAEGWQPAIVSDSLKYIGPAALGPLVARIEAQPELATRKAALNVFGALGGGSDLSDLLVERLEAIKDDPTFCDKAALYVTFAAAPPHYGTVDKDSKPPALKAVLEKLVALRPNIIDKKKASPEEKALAKKCSKYL